MARINQVSTARKQISEICPLPFCFGMRMISMFLWITSWGAPTSRKEELAVTKENLEIRIANEQLVNPKISAEFAIF